MPARDSPPESEQRIQEAAAAWFARLRGDRVDAAERARFEAWLAADPAHRREYEVFERLWQDAGRLQTRKSRAPVRAAGLVAVLGLCAWLVSLVPGGGELVDADTRRHLRLADGSELDVAPRTRVRIDFADDRRALVLETGEIALNVAADPLRPLEVRAAAGVIRDIGTRFDVRRDGERVHVAVAEGRVEIRLPGAGSESRRRLHAGQAADFGADVISPVQPVAAAAALAWTQGRLVVNAEPLADVVAALNRYRRTPIGLDDPELARRRVSGVFLIDDESAALHALAAVAPIRFVTEAGRVHARRIETRP
ncbi:DUF4880 domain-containing protein [Parasulfuritortus cantonensis]|uniref:DUF4880 domain-containing protein n=1 Tax=Parasulfuritortus cantonensis TaxID=2528202 RepID=A0A4R1BDM3_9PROT|nr:FecR domain-containing protein [Parasulfuritortus cantonensis]TCJ15179.1 DUF4880 domain-containing protein [Parasulfuritortus cantonensis]